MEQLHLILHPLLVLLSRVIMVITMLVESIMAITTVQSIITIITMELRQQPLTMLTRLVPQLRQRQHSLLLSKRK
jgi:hypothetical protein